MANILVVEDDPDIQEIIEKFLGVRGHRVWRALDAEAGLAALDTFPADLVILDLILPGMDGWTFAEKKLAHPTGAGIPLLIVSCRSQVIDITMGLHLARAKNYLTKPFSMEKLLREVDRALA